MYRSTRPASLGYNNATGVPPETRRPGGRFRVVGFEATEYEFPSGTTPSYDLYTTQAFASTLLPRTAFGYVYAVRLRHGAADLARLNSQVGALGAEASNEDTSHGVGRSIDPPAGHRLVDPGGARCHGRVGGTRPGTCPPEHHRERGLPNDGRAWAPTGDSCSRSASRRNFVVGLGGAAGALIVATALSPLAPLGEARVAETYTGVSFDRPVLLPGALATVALVFFIGHMAGLSGCAPCRQTTEQRCFAHRS